MAYRSACLTRPERYRKATTLSELTPARPLPFTHHTSHTSCLSSQKMWMDTPNIFQHFWGKSQCSYNTTVTLYRMHHPHPATTISRTTPHAAAFSPPPSPHAACPHEKVRRENMEAFLLTDADQELRSATPGLLGLDMPVCCSWGAAVGHIRERSSSFADLNLKASKRGFQL